MASVNKVILLGNIGKDPEVRTFQNGGKVMDIRMATNSGYKDKEGNWIEKVEWHSVIIKDDKLIDRMAEKLSKGTTIYVEGEIATRKYEKEGVERHVTEIVVPRFNGQVVIVSGGRDAGNRGSHDVPGGTSFKKPQAGNVERSSHSQKKQDGFKPDPDFDLNDEVPF